MSLKSLMAIMPPPPKPFETGKVEDWERVERKLGTPLPQDYKDFITRYGTGKIGDFLIPYNPFSANRNVNLLEKGIKKLDGLRQLREEHAQSEVPFPLFPEAGGVVPWAFTDNGDVLFWRTRGRPDEWTVLVNEARGPEVEEYAGPMTDYLAKLLAGDISSSIFPADFPGQEKLFVARGPKDRK